MVFAAIATIWVQREKIEKLTDERNQYRGNTEILLQDVERYKTADSLNAARVGVLELRLEDFKRYRAADAQLIKSLKVKNRDLANVTSSQQQTIIELSGNVRDSIIYVDRQIVDTLRCIDIADKWFTLHGCARDNEFTGTFENRDSILIVESVKYKRFLNFLWKTNKIKNRKIDVISKNPHTKIMGVEYIDIEK